MQNLVWKQQLTAWNNESWSFVWGKTNSWAIGRRKTKEFITGLSRRSFWPEFRIVWLPKTPASGWGSLWESSSFVPWFVLNAFRDITGVVPDLPWISRFIWKLSFTWVKWVGNVSLYRNYPQNIRSIRMCSVLYPESNFCWVFRNGSRVVRETFHNTFLGCSSKFFLTYCCQFSFVSGCHILGKILISCYCSIIFLLK